MQLRNERLGFGKGLPLLKEWRCLSEGLKEVREQAM